MGGDSELTLLLPSVRACKFLPSGAAKQVIVSQLKLYQGATTYQNEAARVAFSRKQLTLVAESTQCFFF